MTANTPSPNWSRMTLPHSSDYNNAAFTMTGSYPQFAIHPHLDVAHGRFYNWDDMREARRVAFLGTRCSQAIVSRAQSAGQIRFISTIIPIQVIGIMAEEEAGLQL